MSNPENSVGDSRIDDRDEDRNIDADNEDYDGNAEILSRLPPGTILIKQSNVTDGPTRSRARADNVRPRETRESSIVSNPEAVNGGSEILSRLPPGTILIKQSSGSNNAPRSRSREDSDYVRESSKDSTGTNSSGSSSAASYTATGKTRRMQHRAGRSKKIVQVRRNPVRNKKKKLPVDEDFPRPRQRLLSAKRKVDTVIDPVVRKRVKSTPTPYMNTRSVTRKMYTVGATYRAPTVRDSTEWKEWPAHGMHERPIWHPQVGLAFEYVDRNFVSLDGRTYREIVDRPIIEVVSVNPHPERASRDPRDSPCDDLAKSFPVCMHGSFHSVLAYCSQIVAPSYKKNIDTKIRRISGSDDIARTGATSGSSRESPEICHSSGSSSTVQVSKCLVAPGRTISFTSVKSMQGNILQRVFGRASKNTLIFLKPTDPPAKLEDVGNSTVKSVGNVVRNNQDIGASGMSISRLDDSAMISDEALMEMSSIYGKLVPFEKTGSSTGGNSRRVADDEDVGSAARNLGTKGARTTSTSADVTNPVRFSSSNQASEIAKILAEYNEKAAKNSSTGRAAAHCSGGSAGATLVKLDKKGSAGRNNSTAYMSLVEQPKKTRVEMKKNADDDDVENAATERRGLDEVSEIIGNSKPVKIDVVADDRVGAMDLTTAKPRIPVGEESAKSDPDDSTSQQWLRDLIEDTAVLYCAASGVHRDDVADYLNTLDSSQLSEWMES